jgi:hypothetical protein
MHIITFGVMVEDGAANPTDFVWDSLNDMLMYRSVVLY